MNPFEAIPMGNRAKELLINTGKNNGELLCVWETGNKIIMVGRWIPTNDEPRKSRPWYDALLELIELGLINHLSDETYELTESGWFRFDQITYGMFRNDRST